MTHWERNECTLQEVNVRFEADHKTQNMVEFDEEDFEAVILFLRAKQDWCTNKPE